MSRWLEPQEVDVPETLLGAVDGDELLAAALACRGLTTAEAALGFLDPDRYRPRPPS